MAPFFQAGPLFGYGLGYLVLGETLSGTQLAGGALIVAGAAIASFAAGAAGAFRLAVLMLACGLALALATLIFKVFALQVEFWTTTFWLFAGQALLGAALLPMARYRAQLVAV